jgi:hypothetical protein
MKTILLALAFGAGSLAASAASISVTPSNPRPSDTLVMRVDGAATCAFIPANAVDMTDGRVIRVRYQDGSAVTCFAPNPQPTVTLGRLPAGTYRVELVLEASASGGVAAATEVTVAYPPITVLAPPDDYSGHYITGTIGEGVFIEQQGNTAFISFLYLGSDGKPTWVVMPDARWEAAANGTARFAGMAWRVEGVGAGYIAQTVGTGFFNPGGLRFDTGHFSVQIPQTVERELTRLRF